MTTEILPKLKSGSDWIFWWRIDGEELSKQVSEYHTMGILHSARGICFLLLLLSAAFTIVLSLHGTLPIWALADAALMPMFGFLIYKGQQWAIVAAMAIWSIEKSIQVSTQLFGGTLVGAAAAAIWWALYMHAFYLAWKVELAKRSVAGSTATV